MQHRKGEELNVFTLRLLFFFFDMSRHVKLLLGPFLQSPCLVRVAVALSELLKAQIREGGDAHGVVVGFTCIEMLPGPCSATCMRFVARGCF